jgi:hypothetical protein
MKEVPGTSDVLSRCCIKYKQGVIGDVGGDERSSKILNWVATEVSTTLNKKRKKKITQREWAER